MIRPDLSLSFNNLSDFALYERVAASGLGGKLPFIEILWDHYCHLDPYELHDILYRYTDAVSLHVMMSRFMDRTDAEFEWVMERLAAHVEVLSPVRVSDHVARFRIGHRNLVTPLEHFYDDVDHACDRVARYQDRIRMPLLIENYASTEPQGARQIEFCDQVITRTGCGLLFDVSNAVVAELNGFTPVSEWLDYVADREIDCHVGGYALRKTTGLVHDTHDRPLSDETIAAWHAVQDVARVRSVCYERDYRKQAAEMIADLDALSDAIPTTVWSTLGRRHIATAEVACA